MSFENILVVNRGGISRRVGTAARRLGYRSVAVFADADAPARHVGLADEAVPISASPAADAAGRPASPPSDLGVGRGLKMPVGVLTVIMLSQRLQHAQAAIVSSVISPRAFLQVSARKLLACP